MTEGILKALTQGMEEKKRCLQELMQKTEAQSDLLKEEELNWEAYDQLVDEKDELIQKLSMLDTGFQAEFDQVKDELMAEKARYAPFIRKLQEQITAVTAQSTSLMAAEQRNFEVVKQRLSNVRRKNMQSKASSQAVSKYYKSMNRINYIDPQLMDKKK